METTCEEFLQVTDHNRVSASSEINIQPELRWPTQNVIEAKNLRMCPPMRGSTVLSTSMRRISRPSICLDIDSTTHPALRRSVKGSERRPKPRHKIVPFDRGRPKPYPIWHGLRAFVVVRDGNAVIEAKERRWFCGQGSEVSGCGMPKNF